MNIAFFLNAVDIFTFYKSRGTKYDDQLEPCVNILGDVKFET